MNEDTERVEITTMWARSLLFNMIKNEFEKWKIEQMPYDKENSIWSFLFSLKEENYANIE
jgi:hypothetical protein